MNDQQILEKAYLLSEAKAKKMAVTAFTKQGESLTLEDAYAVQQALVQMQTDQGEVISGYKMGLTSRAKQRDVKVFSTIRGTLFQSMEFNTDFRFDLSNGIHPRVEPEVAIVFSKDVPPHAHYREVVSCIELMGPAVEILDSRYKNYEFSMSDVIADNTSAFRYVLGTTGFNFLGDDVRLFGVTVRKNGEIVATGSAAAALGDPIRSVMELSKELALNDKQITKAMTVLTGGLTNSTPVHDGDFIEFIWPNETMKMLVTKTEKNIL